MGGVFSDTDEELRIKRTEARRLVDRLDRLIADQEARLIKARTNAAGDRTDAKLVISITRGMKRLKEERIRAHAALNAIDVAHVGHLENEIVHDVRAMGEEIRGNRISGDEEEETITEEEITRLQEEETEAMMVRLPEVPRRGEEEEETVYVLREEDEDKKGHNPR